MFTIRRLARKVPMNGNYTRKMTSGNRIKGIIHNGCIAATPLVVEVCTVVTMIGGYASVILTVYHSDFLKSYNAKKRTLDKLYRMNQKPDEFFKDKNGVWCVKKE